MPMALPPLEIASDIPPQEVEYLWKPYIPYDFVTMFAGQKGIGKTWVSASIVASVSSGMPLPGTDPTKPLPDPANVVYISSEDPPGHVLRPRLERLGADLSRIWIGFFSAGMDRLLDHITPYVRDHNVRLVVVDPLSSFIPEKKSTISAEDMRATMDPLGKFAHKYNLAMLVDHHLSKQSYTMITDRISGSVQITAQARSVLVAEDYKSMVPASPDEPGKRVLVHAMTNLSAPGPSWIYQIKDGSLVWDDAPCAVTARDLDRDQVVQYSPAQQQAFQIITEHCTGRWAKAETVESAAKLEGVSRPTLYRVATEACKKLKLGPFGEQKTHWILRDSGGPAAPEPDNVVDLPTK